MEEKKACCCESEEVVANGCCCGENDGEASAIGCCTNRTKVRSEEEKHAIEVRINRIIGQLNGIKNMVEQDRYCDDVLIQLSAVNKSVKGLANLVLDTHMHSCLIENIQAGNFEVVDEIVALFKRFQ